MAVFGCFVSGGDFVVVFWSIFLVIKAKQDQSGSCLIFCLIYCVNDFLIDFLRGFRSLDRLEFGWELGVHLGSLKKTLVARTHNLGVPGARAPVRQQPWVPITVTELTVGRGREGRGECLMTCSHA